MDREKEYDNDVHGRTIGSNWFTKHYRIEDQKQSKKIFFIDCLSRKYYRYKGYRNTGILLFNMITLFNETKRKSRVRKTQNSWLTIYSFSGQFAHTNCNNWALTNFSGKLIFRSLSHFWISSFVETPFGMIDSSVSLLCQVELSKQIAILSFSPTKKESEIINGKFGSECVKSPISSLNVAQVESNHERKCVESILCSAVHAQILTDEIW